jgi:hypothetical protein
MTSAIGRLTNPCKIEDVAYLLSPSYSGSSPKVGWAKPRLSPPQSSKSTSSKQQHTPIANQHACFDFTCIRDVPCMSSRHVLLRTAIGATDGSDGWSLKKTWDRVLRAACQELEDAVWIPLTTDLVLVGRLVTIVGRSLIYPGGFICVEKADTKSRRFASLVLLSTIVTYLYSHVRKIHRSRCSLECRQCSDMARSAW